MENCILRYTHECAHFSPYSRIGFLSEFFVQNRGWNFSIISFLCTYQWTVVKIAKRVPQPQYYVGNFPIL